MGWVGLRSVGLESWVLGLGSSGKGKEGGCGISDGDSDKCDSGHSECGCTCVSRWVV